MKWCVGASTLDTPYSRKGGPKRRVSPVSREHFHRRRLSCRWGESTRTDLLGCGSSCAFLHLQLAHRDAARRSRRAVARACRVVNVGEMQLDEGRKNTEADMHSLRNAKARFGVAGASGMGSILARRSGRPFDRSFSRLLAPFRTPNGVRVADLRLACLPRVLTCASRPYCLVCTSLKLCASHCYCIEFSRVEKGTGHCAADAGAAS